MTPLAFAVLACASAGPEAPRAEPATVGRVVAVGDLHGDLDAARAALSLAGVLGPDGEWSGGTTTLVQTGDTTDRGPDSRGVLELIRRLQAQAPRAGGQVVALLGNHEVMNLTGDWRYVSPEDLAGFGGEDARRAALSAGAPLGDWLRSLPITARVGDTVYAHGGVTEGYARLGLTALNQAAQGGLNGAPTPVLGPDGPLWYRGFVQDPPAEACPRLEAALQLLQARRMVVGHTTRKDGRIESRCEGRLLVIDTGISAHYGRHLAVLEFERGDARAIYPTGPVDLPDPP